MNYFACLLLAFFLPLLSVKAQKKSVLSDQDLKEFRQNPLFHSTYAYPSFVSGSALFGDSSTIEAFFNYNLFLQEIHYITGEGDTVTLEYSSGLRQLNIGQDLYAWSAVLGLYKVVLTQNAATLVVQRTMKNHTFGPGTRAIGISTTNSNKTKVRDWSGETVLAIFDNYRLIDKDGRIYFPDKKALLKIYPSHRLEIRQYLQNINSNLSRVDTLITVLKYCQALTDESVKTGNSMSTASFK